jgi:hypothetical protein
MRVYLGIVAALLALAAGCSIKGPSVDSPSPSASSTTSTVSRSRGLRSRLMATRACEALECLATFARASATTKYAVVSTGTGGLLSRSPSTYTGTGER